MIAPDDVPVVVRRRDPDQDVPELTAADVLFSLLTADVALQHYVAVVWGPDDLPAVLGQQVDQPGDLGETFWGFGDVLTQPTGVRPLAPVGAIELVADRPEDVDEDES